MNLPQHQRNLLRMNAMAMAIRIHASKWVTTFPKDFAPQFDGGVPYISWSRSRNMGVQDGELIGVDNTPDPEALEGFDYQESKRVMSYAQYAQVPTSIPFDQMYGDWSMNVMREQIKTVGDRIIQKMHGTVARQVNHFYPRFTAPGSYTPVPLTGIDYQDHVQPIVHFKGNLGFPRGGRFPFAWVDTIVGTKLDALPEVERATIPVGGGAPANLQDGMMKQHAGFDWSADYGNEYLHTAGTAGAKDLTFTSDAEKWVSTVNLSGALEGETINAGDLYTVDTTGQQVVISHPVEGKAGKPYAYTADASGNFTNVRIEPDLNTAATTGQGLTPVGSHRYVLCFDPAAFQAAFFGYSDGVSGVNGVDHMKAVDVGTLDQPGSGLTISYVSSGDLRIGAVPANVLVARADFIVRMFRPEYAFKWIVSTA